MLTVSGRVAAFHYIIALGSNRPHGRYGSPARVIAAATQQLPVVAVSQTLSSRPVGPSARLYANAVALIETDLIPTALLAVLQKIETDFGRRRTRQWGARVLDLDIILWSGGIWSSKGLGIPHAHFRNRDFVLSPLVEVAREWRDPVTHLNVCHLKARLDRNHTRL